MKKILIVIIMCICMNMLASCDRGYSYTIKISSENNIMISETETFENESMELKYDDSFFNRNFFAKYSEINFTTLDTDYMIAKTFYIKLNENNNINFEINLLNANKYLIDFIRVGIIIDEKLYLYKYNDIDDYFDGMEDVEYFISKDEICSIKKDIIINQPTKVSMFFWLESTENLDKNGESHKGYKDHSYDTGTVNIELRIA